MENLTIVSVDGHAQAPPEVWPEYLEARFHDLLPSLHEDQALYRQINGLVMSRTLDAVDVYDHERAYRDGGDRGLHDLDVRLAEMDREGVAGEFVVHGDGRIVAMCFEAGNRMYPLDACQAGVRGYHRWVHDTFGSRGDRLFLVGAVGSGPCADLDHTLSEAAWIADHGFKGTSIPGFTAYAGQPPLSDAYWEPLWALCEERGLALWVHGGHGLPQAALGEEVVAAYAQFEAVGGDIDAFWAGLTTAMFNGELLESATPRQAMWQLMFSGVFDRHPGLTLMMNEVRADWIPATLDHLDAVYDKHRTDLPAKRRPSEYWDQNGMACMSFVHRSEIEMRREIGVGSLTFGRDYPHSEGTWPNTLEWLRDAFAGVPEDEVRMILGGNVIDRLGLDRAALESVAAELGPAAASLIDGGGRPAVAPELLAHFDARGGYLKPAERGGRIDEIAALVEHDLATTWR
jgi:predicted TIM-barrel fold metal-dependent hydrolase